MKPLDQYPKDIEGNIICTNFGEILCMAKYHPTQLIVFNPRYKPVKFNFKKLAKLAKEIREYTEKEKYL